MYLNLYVVIGAIIALFVLYWHLLFQLINQILGKSKLKPIHCLLVYTANVAVILALFIFVGGTLIPFAVMAALMFLEFKAFYKSTLVQNIFCVSACIIHVLAIFTMVTGGLSLFTQRSYEMEASSNLPAVVAIVTLILLNIAIVAVTKLIPLDKIRIINQHKEQQLFLSAWIVVNSIYLLYNSNVYLDLHMHTSFGGNQVIVSISILFGLYIVLLFAIKTVDLLGYQEQNATLSQTVLHEQQYRNSIIKDAVVSYEVNLTHDKLIYGFETEREEHDDLADSYNDMLAFTSRKMIHSDDAEHFIKSISSAPLLHEFELGKSEIAIEYRRLVENGAYIWVRAVANLIKDLHTGDLIAYICVKDIDKEKRRQLELQQKAELDPLTGLYNKEITGKLINEHLASEGGVLGSALFIVDVDNFKTINDHFGHMYGDAVLCELGDKLRKIFGNEDIVGRIGGDEYIAYIKSCKLTRTIEKKAAEICKAFCITYKGMQGDEYAISGSVGISFSPKDGRCFEDLYRYADVALYKAKSNGKSNYQIYDGSEFGGYESGRTKMQADEFAFQKSFRQNKIEYVFKILYQSENPVVAIHSVLELVASHFSFTRGYIFETSKDGKAASNTFEWCADGVTPQLNNLQDLPIEAIATANNNFRKTGFFVLKSLEELQPIERAALEPLGIKSMFQFGIFDKSHLLGFIGFDNCRSQTFPDNAEIDEIATICNILATFFVKQHIDVVSAKDLSVR